MSLNLEFELEARVELTKAREHYRNLDLELAREFEGDFRRTIADILEFPEAFQSVGEGIRRARLSRFPYFIYYSLDPDAIFVYAVAHQRKDQDYWRHRTEPS